MSYELSSTVSNLQADIQNTTVQLWFNLYAILMRSILMNILIQIMMRRYLLYYLIESTKMWSEYKLVLTCFIRTRCQDGRTVRMCSTHQTISHLTTFRRST